MKIVPYSAADQELWDALVENSRNGLFQHRRAYMDYHADRFADCSAVAFDDKERAVAALPAHADGDTVCSHLGLSFGGWLLTGRVDASMMLRIWNEAADYYRAQGFRRLYYRPVPHIFHSYPAEEDLYSLFRAGGRLEATLASSVIDLRAPSGFDSNARRALARALKTGLECVESTDYDAYWAILGEVLATRHGATPVHSLAEITMLAGRFPENIRLFLVCEQGTPVAGTVLYISGHTAHCQYIASGERGRATGALALLFDYLRHRCAADGLAYLDLGTSNENGGRFLNEGLIRQKAGFGARAVAFSSYTIDF